ncbi:MAG: hypothetical protein CME68_04865 [Halobacteriovoraceae bacterium]|nr:hypothetical protein [Halobacteriovoraceae bacterium]
MSKPNYFFKFFIFSAISISILLPLKSKAVLLDKTIAIFNDQIITKSMVERLRNTYETRRFLAGHIYKEATSESNFYINLIIKRFLIRDKLKKFGIEIGDRAVEERINMIRNNFKLNQEQMLAFLSSKGISFKEYFEVMREGIEYQQFFLKHINPLVNVSEQEIKNLFIKKQSTNKTISFNYYLIRYSFQPKKNTSVNKKKLFEVIKKYHTTGIVPSDFSTLEKIDHGNLSEEDLNKKIKSTLKPLGEGEFSFPYYDNETFTSFFIKEKNLKESESYKRSKNILKQELIDKKSQKVLGAWIKREKSQYHIKYFLKPIKIKNQ